MTKKSAFENWKEKMLKLPTYQGVVSDTKFQTIECNCCNEEFEHALGNKQAILCDECRDKINLAKSPEELLEMFSESIQETICGDIIKSVLREFSFSSTSTRVVEDVWGPEVIQVEGSDELRRQVNGAWQHRHGSNDYWHPAVRVHKVVKE